MKSNMECAICKSNFEDDKVVFLAVHEFDCAPATPLPKLTLLLLCFLGTVLNIGFCPLIWFVLLAPFFLGGGEARLCFCWRLICMSKVPAPERTCLLKLSLILGCCYFLLD